MQSNTSTANDLDQALRDLAATAPADVAEWLTAMASTEERASSADAGNRQ